MKSLLALILTLASLTASATTFSPATDGTYKCISYCVGYVTSDDTKLTQANLQTDVVGFKLTLTIDGIAYSGKGSASDLATGITLSAADGTYKLVTVVYTTKRTCTVSGRGQHCTIWYFVTSGTVQ